MSMQGDAISPDLDKCLFAKAIFTELIQYFVQLLAVIRFNEQCALLKIVASLCKLVRKISYVLLGSMDPKQFHGMLQVAKTSPQLIVQNKLPLGIGPHTQFGHLYFH